MEAHLKFNSYLLQVGTDIEEVTAEKTFAEPRLAIFADKNMNGVQAFILGEGKVLFEVYSATVLLTRSSACLQHTTPSTSVTPSHHLPLVSFSSYRKC